MIDLFLIDSGHGGIIDGEYVTSPDKMHSFSNGEIIYEGVLNRSVKRKLFKKMDKEGIPYIDLCPSQLDLRLEDRVFIANRYASYYGKNNVLGISLHSNAGGGSGFEIYTSPGETYSDVYAEIYLDIFKRYHPSFKIRTDLSDGDSDKEASFYILEKTLCPFILPEWGFFDNYMDYKFITKKSNQEWYAEMIIHFMKLITKRS